MIFQAKGRSSRCKAHVEPLDDSRVMLILLVTINICNFGIVETLYQLKSKMIDAKNLTAFGAN